MYTRKLCVMVQKVMSSNTVLGQLETLCINPVVNGYLFTNQGKIKHREVRNGLRLSYVVPEKKWTPRKSGISNFGDFRCGALLFMVIHVIYKYKNK